MTVARLSMTAGYRRQHGLEGAVLRLGMTLVTWAHDRARLHDADLEDRRHRQLHLARLEAEREASLARAALLRIL